MSRFRRFSLVAVLTAMLLALGLPTFAASPVTVSGSVTDPSEWLESSDRESVEEAARKAAASGVNISFVFVEDLSGDSVSQWCAQTLENSTLGYSDVVFVLAYTERVDGACSENSQTSARINAAIASADKQFKSNPLTSNDAANGAAAFANALIASSASSTPSASPQPTRSSSSADRTNLYILSALFFGGLSLFGITVAASSRRSKKSAAHAMSIDSVAAEKAVQEANRQLLAADEQVRTATDELNFARAQFGLTSTDEFARAIENAKATVTRCFDLQVRMNDATATTERLELAKKLMRDLGANLNPLSQIQAAFATKRAEEATLPERIREARERLAEELTDLERAKAANARMGYVLSATRARASVSEPASNGAGTRTVSVEAEIANSGLAPFYADWPLEFALLDPSGAVVGTQRAGGVLPTIQPGASATARADITVPADAGDLAVTMRVVNPLPGGAPVAFANEGMGTRLEGALTLPLAVSTLQTGPAPSPSASPDPAGTATQAPADPGAPTARPTAGTKASHLANTGSLTAPLIIVAAVAGAVGALLVRRKR